MPRAINWIVFLTIALSLIGGVHFWIWGRLVRDLELPLVWQRLLGVLIGLLAVSVPLTLYLSRVVDPARGRGPLLALYSWLGITFWLVVLLGGGELIRIAAWLWERGVSEAAPVFIAERRTHLARALAGAVLLLTAGFTLSGLRSGLGRVQVKRVEIKLPKLPKALDGFRIVQLTDVHVGPTIGLDFMQEVVATCNQLRADAVVITGDLVDGSVERLATAVAPLADLRSRHGTFFVTGNHEYYSGASAWCRKLTELGIRVLRNEHVSLTGSAGGTLDLAGVDDLHGARTPGHGPDLSAALQGRDPRHPLVLLAHQPRMIHQAVKAGVDLQLSGHTHGGQLWPWHFFVKLQQPVVAGLAWFEQTAVYVSSGTGYWGPPLRLGAPAEITEVVLRAG